MTAESDLTPEQSTDLTEIAAQKIAPRVGVFFGTIAGSPSYEIGELIAGHFRMRRFKQGLRQMERAQALLDEAGLEPHQVPMRTLVPLLEAGSSEEEPEMSERWAALLANAALGRADVPPSFPQVLSQLEPVQARMLDALFDVRLRIGGDRGRLEDAGVPAEAFGLAFSQSDDELEYHADCLTRLGVVLRSSLTPRVRSEGSTDGLMLTTFGVAFLACCRPPAERMSAVQGTDRPAEAIHAVLGVESDPE